ncbi:MAG: hypothetical protein ACI8RD_005133, partial [Bacillariaceae sp.]
MKETDIYFKKIRRRKMTELLGLDFVC